jgi:DNA-binding response OmpR family regulator
MNRMSQETAVSLEETSSKVLTDKSRFVDGERSITGYENRKHILVVDDSKDIKEFLSILLLKDGIVCTAVNGLDAISMMVGNHFDVVVSDIEMPVMNGIELYRNVPQTYKDSFLFFSGTVNVDYMNYISMNNLLLFRKPDEILKLHRAVQVKIRNTFPEITSY